MSEPLPKLDINDLRTYRAHRQRVGPILERIRRRELREMTDKRAVWSLSAMLELARPEQAKKRRCGLADFYRRWRKSS